jgi:hypothetical protein
VELPASDELNDIKTTAALFQRHWPPRGPRPHRLPPPRCPAAPRRPRLPSSHLAAVGVSILLGPSTIEVVFTVAALAGISLPVQRALVGISSLALGVLSSDNFTDYRSPAGLRLISLFLRHGRCDGGDDTTSGEAARVGSGTGRTAGCGGKLARRFDWELINSRENRKIPTRCRRSKL